MNKVTLAFPTYDSLWLFHGQSSAINVAVAPKRNTITGLFSPDEISLALLQFGAIQLQGNPAKGIDPSRQPGGRDRSAGNSVLPDYKPGL